MADRPRAAETTDPAGARVVLDGWLWDEKIARDHPEIASHKDDALRAVSAPNHVAPDPASANRQRFYLATPVRVDGYSWS